MITRAVLVQLLAAALLLPVVLLAHRQLPPMALAFVQGALAAVLAALMQSERWWLLLHLLFWPAVIWCSRLHAPGWIYPSLLLLVLLVFGASHRSRVPLFLSNRRTVARLAEWLPRDRPLRILDAGSGTGRFALELARLRPDCKIIGIEQAWLPTLVARLAARRLGNVQLRRGDFWQESFAGFDLVYAFLSPVPMEPLWEKARSEMRAGTWLVSNSFAVPGIAAIETLQVDDFRHTHLHCYQPAQAGTPTSAVAV